MIYNKTIAEENSQKLKAYVAKPPAGHGPGVILLHEVYGVNQSLKATADELAANGFVVYCPNLYWEHDQDASFEPQAPGQKMTPELERQRNTARELMFEKLDHAKISDYVKIVADDLRNDPDCTGKVACMGSCLGGKGTYLAALEGTIDAGVAYYPTPALKDVFRKADAMAAKTPLLFVLGGADPYVVPAEKEAIRDVSKTIVDYIPGLTAPLTTTNTDGNPDITTHYFSASGHAFARVGGRDYDAPVANYVTALTLSFLNETIGGGNMPVNKPEIITPASDKYLPQPKK